MFRLKSNHIQSGFSLVEMAIVLVIISILLGSGFGVLSAYLDNAKQSHTKGSLELTKRAMLNYVVVNKHLPCPDSDLVIDGEENRESTGECTTSLGSVPYKDIGLSQAVAGDDYGNVFKYAINSNATLPLEIVKKTDSASYFASIGAPVFDLYTPPTENSATVNESYKVWKCNDGLSNASCDATTANAVIELSDIPVVIVAFNENGSSTSLGACVSETGAEAVNCNGNKDFIRKVFEEDAYDDQLVTISGYEIKQKLDLIEFTLTVNDSAYDGYEVIIRRDVNSANDLNVGNGEDNTFYIDENTDLKQNGDLNANIQLKDGNDTLYIKGDVGAKGNADMGSGNDTLTVNTNISIGGIVTLGKGDDAAVIGGILEGSLNAGDGDDDVTVKGTVYGVIDMGTGADDLYLYGEFPIANIDGGGEVGDVLHTTKLETDFTAAEKEALLLKFETIDYNYTIPIP